MAQRKKSRKKKKSKVYIPLNNIIALSAIVVGLCTALLIINVFAAGKTHSSGSNVSAEKPGKSVVKPAETKKDIAVPLKAPVSSEEKKKPEAVIHNKKSESKSETKKTTVSENAQKKTVEQKKSLPTKESSSLPEKKPEQPVLVPSASVQSHSLSSAPDQKITDSSLPDIPPAVNGAQLVIIFDDGGHNLEQLSKCISLPFPVTVAVLPGLAHSRDSASRVRASGNELILHQPMQALNTKMNPGPGAIRDNMNEEEIRALIFQNLSEIGPVSGMNNHEGSLVTGDKVLMSYVMKAASDEGIYFLDSRTNSNTAVPYVAEALGYSYYERNVFLDNTRNRAEIIKEIMKGVSIANKNGVAIMIGHVWSSDILPGILREFYPELKLRGYTFSTVSNSRAEKFSRGM